MTIPTVVLDENTPAGDSNIALGDNRIREFKTQVREILEVDHKFESSGQDADMGKHKKVSLIEQADLGTGATGKPILGAQTVSGKAELVFTDGDNNDVQITSAGKIKLSSGRLENNTSLTGRNAAGNADINIIKVNASDQIETTVITKLKDASILETSGAPTTDAMIANKKYVDDQVLVYGTPTSKSAGTSYQASTDGSIYGYCTNAGAGIDMDIFTDSSNPPTTQVGRMQFGAATSMSIPFCIPIKSGNYYKLVNSVGTLSAYYFIGKV